MSQPVIIQGGMGDKHSFVTAGGDFARLAQFLPPGSESYSAAV